VKNEIIQRLLKEFERFKLSIKHPAVEEAAVGAG